MMRDTGTVQTRYSSMAIFLHWALALLLAFQIGLGWKLEDLPRGQGFEFYQFHKSMGISIRLLTLLRIAVRLFVVRPAKAVDSVWAKRLSSAVHLGLYVFMIAVPISGWVMVSSSKFPVPTQIFGLFPWPNLPVGRAFHEPAETVHGLLSWLGIALFALHVLGALRHHFLIRDGLLARMVPMSEKIRKNLGMSALVTAIALALVLGGLMWGNMLDLGSPANANARGLTGQTALTGPIVPAASLASPDAATAAAAADTLAKADATEAAKATEAAAAEKLADGAATGTAVRWKRAPGGSLNFVASWSGTPINGRFNNWNPDVVFAASDLKNSRIAVTINLASATTNDADRDASLSGADFFNSAAFPDARFASSSISSTGGNTYRAAGTLSLRGKSRPVTLNFTLKFTGDDVEVSGSTTLDRTAFGVGQGQWAATDQIAGAVKVNFAFKARKVPQ